MGGIRILVIGLILGLGATGAAAQPDSLWSQTYGGVGNEECRAMVVTPYGGFALAGIVERAGQGNPNFLLISTDSIGDWYWEYISNDSDSNICNSIVMANDGGFALAGMKTAASDSSSSFMIEKVDIEGNVAWSGSYYQGTVCNHIIQTQNLDYILVGCFLYGRHQSTSVVEVDSLGYVLGYERWNYDYPIELTSIIQDTDGLFIYTGQIRLFPGHYEDYFTITKVRTFNQFIWDRRYAVGVEGRCNAMLQTEDGGFVMAGFGTVLNGEAAKFVVIKTDADGDSLWSRFYGGFGRSECRSIVQTPDGGYALAGTTNSFGAGGNDYWLLRINATGDSLWSCTFGGEGDDYCYSVAQTSDGGFALAGYTNSFGAGGNDVWLVKTAPDPVSVNDPSPLTPYTLLLEPPFPNPFNSSTTISYDIARPGFVRLGVYDAGGRLVGTVKEGYAGAGKYSAVWNGGNVGSGTYFLNLEAGGETMVKPVVLVK